MKVTLTPIYHEESYTEIVESELVDYLRETLFDPLLDLVSTSGVQLRENAVSDWVSFLPSQGSLGVSREDMPQIRGSDQQGFRDFVCRRGFVSWETKIKVSRIRPTQDGYDPKKVQQARDYSGVPRPVFVSSCHHILDGHHQWVAKSIDDPSGEMAAVYFDAPITTLLREASIYFGRGTSRQNAEPERDPRHSAVWYALAAGVIWYAHDTFTGAFSAAISRELRALGARRVGVNFVLAQSELPMALKGVVAMSVQRSEALHAAVLATLDRIETNLPAAPTGISLVEEVDKITNDLQEQLDRSVSEAESLSAPTPIPPGMPEELREKAAAGVNRAIKNFSLEATQNLRDKVKANLSEGGRTDTLAKIIEVEFGVAKRKARFIADQETSLLVSKFREERYRDLGSTEYVWDDSGDLKVRHDHHELNGRTFSWDAPPITDRATGARNHPGEDFNCRCVARPRFNVVRVAA